MSDATLTFVDLKGNGGQVVETDWEWPLTQDLGIHEPWDCRWYGVQCRQHQYGISWYLVAHVGCMWDYATGWFDADYIKEASLGHDILHWLIARGVIAEHFNAAIDEEFYQILIARGGIAPWRARVLRSAVRLVDQKRTGIDRRVIRLHKGQRL